MVEAEGSGAMFPGFEVQLHLILSYVTMGILPTCYFHFPRYKMRPVIMPILQFRGFNELVQVSIRTNSRHLLNVEN